MVTEVSLWSPQKPKNLLGCHGNQSNQRKPKVVMVTIATKVSPWLPS